MYSLGGRNILRPYSLLISTLNGEPRIISFNFEFCNTLLLVANQYFE